MRLFINKKNEGLTSWALNFDVDKDWNSKACSMLIAK